MAKVFKNTDNTDIVQLNGWGQSNVYGSDRIAKIQDTIGAGIALAKMGTSIPTPFARIFLFNTAFGQVKTLGHNTDNVYSRLVSECLDFIEFIYGYGDRITVKRWNVVNNIILLENSNEEKHNTLGNCLKKFARDLDVTDIYLFYYDEVLIGGSSPYTLVYTSPNWSRINPMANAQGLAGNKLFKNYADPHELPVPLHQRDRRFREYLTRYMVAFRGIQRFNNSAFRRYIFDNQGGLDDNDMKTLYNNISNVPIYDVTNFQHDYDLINCGAAIDILGAGGLNALLLGKQKTDLALTPGVIEDDYKILATSTRYTGNNHHCPRPLVLSEFGVTDALYTAGNSWQGGTQIVYNPNESLSQRILPGGGHIQYPFLTVEDFLEDKLIKVPYEIDDSAFYTFGNNVKYLLPLKKDFFEYFEVNDIGNIPDLSFSMTEDGRGGVNVVLNIPIGTNAHHFCIPLKKHYENGDIKTIPAVPGFSLALFPSYRIINGNIPNNYAIMVYDGQQMSNSINLYAITPTSINSIQITSSVTRTQNVSTYLNVDNSFDIITVRKDDFSAMILPKFKEVNVNPAANPVTVGIDFGTTNSYVCISFDDGVTREHLSIDSGDRQIMMLNKIDLSQGDYGNTYMNSYAGMAPFNQAVDREFSPLLLGDNSDVKLPYRTVTCESNDFENAVAVDRKLFGHINVGFNFMKEITDLANLGIKYNTTVKWGVEDPTVAGLNARQDRVKKFVLQIVWMIKNKVMLSNSPTNNYNVYVTFPAAMSIPSRNNIMSSWTGAFNNVLAHATVPIQITESVAPYYYILANGAAINQNAVNIDIGGGTTDMLFTDTDHNALYYDSSLFAGNDIWGDGKHLIDGALRDNGFVQLFETLLNGGSLAVTQGRKDAYFMYKNMVKNSADLINYVFQYDNEFGFTSYIQHSKQRLMPILFAHLGALVYHVCAVLKEKNIAVPHLITFSGMGSKYIQLISNNPADITQLVKGFLALFMGYGFNDAQHKMPNDFSVKFEPDPKIVTAQGAVLKNNANVQNVTCNYTEEPICVHGINNVPANTTYTQAGEYKDQVIADFNNFLERFLEDQAFTSYLRTNYGITFDNSFTQTLRQAADNSFDLMAISKDPNVSLNESMFFWTLKNGLYEVSKL